MAWCGTGGRGDIRQLVQELLKRADAVVNRCQLGLIERDLLAHSQEVRFPLQQLSTARVLRGIEPALGARHPMRALVKEVVGAVAVAQIVELPRLFGGLPTQNKLPINQNLDRAHIAREIAGITERLRQLRGADIQVMLCRVCPLVPEPALEFKQRQRLLRVE